MEIIFGLRNLHKALKWNKDNIICSATEALKTLGLEIYFPRNMIHNVNISI